MKAVKIRRSNAETKYMKSIKDDTEYYPINLPSYYNAIFSKNNTINESYSFNNLNMILSPAGR
jgi:hypothetical protein